jgi:UDP-N-acetylglucosamine 2-epimerase (non-hydrolysing)
MCGAIRSLAEAAGESLAVVLPVHPNPAVAETVRRVLGGIANVMLVEPMDYISTVHALRASDLVLTDSGGIQEESCALGVPALVLRDETERLEGVEAGCLELVGTDPARIVERATARLAEATPSNGVPAQTPFGDGHASTRIVDALIAAG